MDKITVGERRGLIVLIFLLVLAIFAACWKNRGSYVVDSPRVADLDSIALIERDSSTTVVKSANSAVSKKLRKANGVKRRNPSQSKGQSSRPSRDQRID